MLRTQSLLCILLYTLFAYTNLSIVNSLAETTKDYHSQHEIWEFTEKILSEQPESISEQAQLQIQKAQFDSLSWPEDPTVEYARTDRETPGTNSTVESFSLQQKIPFWSLRSRQKKVQKEFIKSSEFKSKQTELEIKNRIITQFYEVSRYKEEQRHLQERRTRFNLIRKSLAVTPSTSPGGALEKKMIESAILLTEQMFEQTELELFKHQKQIEYWGQFKIRKIQVEWISKENIQKLKQQVKLKNEITPPILQHYRYQISGFEKELDSLTPIPEFSLNFISDKERGGSQEHNNTLGLSLTFPINSWLSPNKRRIHAQIEQAQAIYKIQDRESELERKTLEEELDLLERSLVRFDYNKIKKLETTLFEAEKSIRQGWISLVQLVEIERQIHEQISVSFDIQLQAVRTILKSCLYFTCNPKDYIKGQVWSESK